MTVFVLVMLSTVTFDGFKETSLWGDLVQWIALAPAFHHWLFSDDTRKTAVLNIGGIANVTMLIPGNSDVIGFDTGPGNSLLDGWIRSHRDQPVLLSSAGAKVTPSSGGANHSW